MICEICGQDEDECECDSGATSFCDICGRGVYACRCASGPVETITYYAPETGYDPDYEEAGYRASLDDDDDSGPDMIAKTWQQFIEKKLRHQPMPH